MSERVWTIGIVLYPGFTQLDATGPHEVLSRVPGARVLLLSADGNAVCSESGLTIEVTTSFADAPPLDVVIAVGGPGVNAVLTSDAHTSFIRRTANTAEYVVSICTGALLLGAAGLLTGYQATTHWLAMDFLRDFGAVPINERVVIDRSLLTAAGVSAGIDLALVLAARIAGEAAAREIQLMIEYAPQPPFDSGNVEQADADLVEKVRVARNRMQDVRKQQVTRAVMALRAPSK